MRCISSRVLAPVAAAIVLAVWRRSCGRNSGGRSETSTFARSQIRFHCILLRVPPPSPVNSRALVPRPTKMSRWSSSSAAMNSGTARVRMPLFVFGGLTMMVPFRSSCSCCSTLRVRFSTLMCRRSRANASPRRRPTNPKIKTMHLSRAGYRIGEFPDLLDGRDGPFVGSLDSCTVNPAGVLGDETIDLGGGQDGPEQPIDLRAGDLREFLAVELRPPAPHR